jgi:hypothetical protein
MKALVSEITPEGFKLNVWGKRYTKVYQVSRELFAWFLGATDEELTDVGAGKWFDSDHGYPLCWHKLDVDLGTLDFDHPEERWVYQASTSEREKYHKQKESTGNADNPVSC